MTFEGERLQETLRKQVGAVVLVDVDGRERRGISPSYAADYIHGRAFVGYGKNRVIELVKAVEAPRRRRFATPPDIRELLTDFPRRSVAHTVRQDGLEWRADPAHSNTGAKGEFLTVHFGEKGGER